MKKIKFLLLVFITISLTSCFDLFETININENGSGIVEIKMDMSRAFISMGEMTKSFGNKPSKKKKEKMDSSFSYKSYTDTSSVLNAEEKAVFAKATARINLDEANNIGYVLMKFPFTNAEEFETIQNVLDKDNKQANIFGSISNIIGGSLGKSSEIGGSMEKSGEDGLPTKNLIFKLTQNSFSSQVAPAKTATNKPKEDMSMMPKEFLEMMKMKLILTINLPRPLKSINNTNTIISSDKKKVEIKKDVNLDESFTSQDLNFSIDF